MQSAKLKLGQIYQQSEHYVRLEIEVDAGGVPRRASSGKRGSSLRCRTPTEADPQGADPRALQ